jgi:hypothetical protein
MWVEGRSFIVGGDLRRHEDTRPEAPSGTGLKVVHLASGSAVRRELPLERVELGHPGAGGRVGDCGPDEHLAIGRDVAVAGSVGDTRPSPFL